LFLLVYGPARFLGIAPADWKMRKIIKLTMKKMIKMMKKKLGAGCGLGYA
jgi:hypothetical protein